MAEEDHLVELPDGTPLGVEHGTKHLVAGALHDTDSGSVTMVRMQIVNFPAQQHNQVGARGECPHCSDRSYMRPVGGPYLEANPHQRGNEIANAAQCESCKEFVLVVGDRNQTGNQVPYTLVNVYPLGKPDDRVPEAVPQVIAADFKEALRCHWIQAYKATVGMCRRAVQATALEKKASAKKTLVDQIDELAAKGIITEPLKRMAHEVRLTGNVGAHPDEDGLKDVTEQDASDVVEFTREVFHHVYVMPAKLEARKKKEGQQQAASSETGTTGTN